MNKSFWLIGLWFLTCRSLEFWETLGTCVSRVDPKLQTHKGYGSFLELLQSEFDQKGEATIRKDILCTLSVQPLKFTFGKRRLKI